MLHIFRFLISKTFILNLILIILLLSGIIFSILYYLEDYTKHGYVIEVPNVVDLNYSDLDELLAEDNNFTAVINDSIYQKGTKGGTVLEQNPRAGTTVKEGRKLYLTVASNYPPKIGMPKLLHMSLRQATSLMETYGLEIGKLEYKHDLCTNCILDQQINGESIETGDKIARGSTIDLVIGQGLGNELTPVPYLINSTAKEAEVVLKLKYLNIGITEFDTTVYNAEDSMNAFIYRQEPFFSEAPSVRMGTSVDLFLTLDTNKVVHTVNPVDSF